MILFDALPPRLYEIISCSIAATSLVALVICVRYLFTEYRFVLNSFSGDWRQAFTAMWQFRLALGFTVFLFGESPRMTWVWLARYLTNIGVSQAWMGTLPWLLVPIVASAVSVIGILCIVRALVPRAWGRFGYIGSILTALAAVTATQIFR